MNQKKFTRQSADTVEVLHFTSLHFIPISLASAKSGNEALLLLRSLRLCAKRDDTVVEHHFIKEFATFYVQANVKNESTLWQGYVLAELTLRNKVLSLCLGTTVRRLLELYFR